MPIAMNARIETRTRRARTVQSVPLTRGAPERPRVRLLKRVGDSGGSRKAPVKQVEYGLGDGGKLLRFLPLEKLLELPLVDLLLGRPGGRSLDAAHGLRSSSARLLLRLGRHRLGRGDPLELAQLRADGGEGGPVRGAEVGQQGGDATPGTCPGGPGRPGAARASSGPREARLVGVGIVVDVEGEPPGPRGRTTSRAPARRSPPPRSRPRRRRAEGPRPRRSRVRGS